MSDRVQIRRALISVFDRTGVEDLASAIIDGGGSIVSSGGTAQYLRDAGFEVIDVSDVTGFPEMLDGRVKTLHPMLHGGILADRGKPEHLEAIASHGIEPIDLVVCNLYPFDKKVVASTPDAEAVPLIDVGGPSMLRAAAKNHGSVGVLVDVGDYERVIAEIAAGGLTFELRRWLAGKAFAHLSAYDAAIAEWFVHGEDDDAPPGKITIAGDLVQELRYGENPHQPAALYRRAGSRGVASAEQLQGKALSYINYLDLDAAYRLVSAFSEPAASIIKHTNPCGAAIGVDIEEAYRLAFECDTRAAFGGIVGLNRTLTMGVVEQIREAKLKVECIAAPDYEPAALEQLGKRKDLRLMRMPEGFALDPTEVHSISGGFLVQKTDPVRDERSQMTVVTQRQPTEAEWVDLLFSWTVCSRVKSNAIVLANHRQAVGVGAGQMSRVEAFEIAVRRAGDRAKGAVAASDALIPFPDNIDVGAEAGVSAIIQTGGSVKDDEVIAAADAAGIAMVFTGTRHFWH